MVGEAQFSDATEVSATESALATTLDGEAVILETESGSYYGLNEVATLIWDELDDGATIHDLETEILAEYDVSEAQCRADLEGVLEDLADKGLVTFSEV
jgi:hypothetical protein